MRKEKGITLIALIVTIIILLILAGVAIITLTGENSLLKRANNAVEKTKEAEAVEVINLQLISCRVEYTLNSNVDIPTYVEKENSKITVEVDSSLNPDNNPVGYWTMTYGEYEFEIYDLQILYYYKEGNKIKPSIKDINVTGEYQFASISDSKIDVEFKVELPEELAGSTVSVNVTTEATGIVEGNYDNATGIYTGTMKTDGTTNTNGTYTYEVKATKDGEEYTTKTVVTTDKFLGNPEIEVPEESKKWNELTINVKNNYPKEAGLYYKYYISDTTTYVIEEFTQETSVTKTELKAKTEYNIKVEVYLKDQATMVETTIQETTAEKITEIRYIEDLEAINEDLTASYTLMNDLDFKERNSYKTDEKYNYYNEDTNNNGTPDHGWTCLAKGIYDSFTGTLDGNYYSIKNMRATETDQYSFIYRATGADFKRLKFESYYASGNRQVGGYQRGLIAVAYGCNFYQVGVNGYVSVNNDSPGGLLVSQGTHCTINECFADGSVSVSYWNGSPCPNEQPGGLGVFTGNSKITNSYTKGGFFAHGLANIQGGVENCYSIATSTHPLVYLNISVVSSFWNREDSGDISDSYEGEKTKTEMQTQSTYTNAGWDFDTVWEMDPDTGYPRLQWEKNIK